MVTEDEIKSWIAGQFRSGIHPDVIKQTLITYKMDPALVDEYLAQRSSSPNPLQPASPAPQAAELAKTTLPEQTKQDEPKKKGGHGISLEIILSLVSLAILVLLMSAFNSIIALL